MDPLVAFETPKKSLDLGFMHSDYVFALAHLWEDSWYRNAMFKQQAEGKKIYLDNSAFELKASINFDRYLNIIREIEPDVVVVPDALGNIAETIKLAKFFYQSLPGSMLTQTKFMIVPQGKDTRERLKCFHILRSFGYPFQVVGLPRHACPNRFELLLNLRKFVPKARIHYLGLPDPQELRGIGPFIDSLDTSWPAKFAAGRDLTKMLDFEKDVCDEQKFIEGVAIIRECLEDTEFGGTNG